MADIAELRIRLTADASGLKATLGDAQVAVRQTASAFEHARESITPLNQGIELLEKAFEALKTIGEGIAHAFEAPIEAAAEQDAVLAKLEATLGTSNQLTAEYSANLVKLAEAEALVKGVQNDVVLGAERTLIAFGAQRAELPKLLDAVLDLGTKTGDVAQAAFLVGKALVGETGALSRYGIVVDQTASASDKLQQALDQINKIFGGQAAAQAATFSGRISIVGVAFTELQEAIGRVITQNPAVLTMLSGFAQGFARATEALEPFLPVLEELVTGLAAAATINVADGLDALAESAKGLPVVATTLRAFASGLRDSNTAALQAKASLKAVEETVAQGASGADRFTGILREIGPTGQLVLRTAGAALRELGEGLKTLTDKLNDADTQLRPLATLGEGIGARLKKAFDDAEPEIVATAARLGTKIATALFNAAKSQLDLGQLIQDQLNKVKLPTAPAAGGPGGGAFIPSLAAQPPTPIQFAVSPASIKALQSFQEEAKKPVVATIDANTAPALAKAKSFTEQASKFLLGLVFDAEAAAGDIPEAFADIKLPPIAVPPPTALPPLALRADNTSALATIDATVKAAQAPIVAPFTIDTKQADDASQGFVTRLLTSMGAVAGTIFNALAQPLAGLLATPPRAAQGPAAGSAEAQAKEAAAAAQVRIDASKRIEASLQAQVALQAQYTAAAGAQAALDAQRAKLAEDNTQALLGEVRAFNELNAGKVAPIKIDLDTTEAKATAKELQEGIIRISTTTPKVVVGMDATQAKTEAEGLEARVARLDKVPHQITATLVTAQVEPEAKALEARVAKLDALAPTIHATVSVATGQGATLDDMLAKAHEIDTFTPNLKVEAGKSFTESQSSVTALIEHYEAINTLPPAVLPPVDTTAVATSFGVAGIAAKDFIATASTPATVNVTANTTGLAAAGTEVAGFKAAVATPVEAQVDTTKARGSFTAMKSTVDDISAQAKQGFSFTANIARVTEQLGVIRSDVSAGVDPITISAEASKAQKVIEDLKTQLKALAQSPDFTPKIQAEMQLKIDKAQAQLNGLQAEAEKPATKPVDANTQAALAKVAELQAAAERAIGAVAHGFGEAQGPVATGADVQQSIDQLRQDLVAAIEAGDEAAQARLRAAGQEFLRTFGSGATAQSSFLTAGGKKQLTHIIGPFAGVGGFAAQFARGGTGGLGGDPAVNEAIKQAATKAQQERTNQLLAENNDIAAANLTATKELGGALTSGRFVQGVAQSVQRNQRSLLGDQTLRVGA